MKTPVAAETLNAVTVRATGEGVARDGSSGVAAAAMAVVAAPWKQAGESQEKV